MGLKEFKAAEEARKQQENKAYIQRDLEDQIAEEKTTQKVPEGMNSDIFGELEDVSTSEDSMLSEFYSDREIKQTNSETSQNTDQMSQTEAAQEAKAMKAGTKDSPINLSEITKMLSDGYTRYKKDDRGIGSVQEKLSLSFAQTKTLFSHPKLKGLKTKHASALVINDDLPEKVGKEEVFK